MADLCRGIEGPPPVRGKRGRKPHLLRDCVFASALKVYSTFSTRRFQCDLSDAHGEGYLTADVPSMRICDFLQNPVLTPILKRLIVLSSLPLKTVETVFAPDSTGFGVSKFVRWYDEKYGRERSGKDWVKAHAICGVKTNIVTGVEIGERTAGDCPMFKPLVETTAENFTVKEVPADKAYLSADNLAQVEKLGGTAYVPFKSNSQPGEAGSLWQTMYHYFQFRRDEFLVHYHQRSNAESTFSAIKRKFGDAVRSKQETAMKNEVLCKFLCHNICCVIMEQTVLGIAPVFWPEEAAGPAGGEPDVLRFPAGMTFPVLLFSDRIPVGGSMKKQGTSLAYIRWFDSAIYKGEACQPELLSGTCENESAGVLVKEDDKEIIIALDRCLDTKDIRLVLCVPKANVRSIRRFNVASSAVALFRGLRQVGSGDLLSRLRCSRLFQDFAGLMGRFLACGHPASLLKG